MRWCKEKLDLRIGGHTLGAQSDDTFEIDERIVTEMINNGIAHRDYASSATVQVELFKDRLTVFSPGPFHPDMKFEMLSVDHQSYATNPIIDRALYFVQYIEEVGSGTTDIFEHCAAHGLEPPIFEVDARHVSVTVIRPTFDENGRKVGQKIAEVGRKSAELGQKVDFGALASVGRKDFRMMCERVFKCLAKDSRMSRRRISQELGIAESTVQCATNALQEVGLLRREGRGRGSNWQEALQGDRRSGRVVIVSWTKREIVIGDGQKVPAQMPVIISASRSTDIPAFYSDWFVERFNGGDGYVKWFNPFNNVPLYVEFKKTRLIVFWSKYPRPMFESLPNRKKSPLDVIDASGRNYYFQFTLNDYDVEKIEPRVSPLEERVETFKRLAKRLGRDRVVWRFDPLILSDSLTVGKLQRLEDGGLFKPGRVSRCPRVD